MPPKNILHDLETRIDIASSWDKRIKQTGMRRRKFCQKYKIHPAALCRHIKGVYRPEWPAVNKVEKALKKEGV